MIYSIKEVAEITGLSIYTIRYYDKEGLLPFVARNDAGIRVFSESDINQIQTICCLKNTGMALKDIRNYIECCMEGTASIDERSELLTAHRESVLAKIKELEDNLKIIDGKLEIYNSPNSEEIITFMREYVKNEKKTIEVKE
ncbi:MerR family transcriptional regulator [Floricoccus penangensis]|uniref:MerR family transcriptional regulator n=1 Tax=Floricoccus penangensis TaxID=1859475 RepID=UPI002040860B|nr:MerR family transcriptional regulator [Floricoccus penangensis]URZ87858.1 MerR family transcriptional regulator [Floricoccus penangensis]